MGSSDLDDLEGFAQQVDRHPDRRDPRGWKRLSPGLSHGKPAREKAEVQPEPVEPTPAAPPTIARRDRATLGRLFTDYRTLIETCRARADELEISRSEIDRLGGLPSGYAGKLLGKECGGSRKKTMWPIALESMLGVLGLKIILIEDDVAAARTRAQRTPVDSAQQRFGNVCRISATLLPPPSQPASPPVLTVVSAKRQARGTIKYG